LIVITDNEVDAVEVSNEDEEEAEDEDVIGTKKIMMLEMSMKRMILGCVRWVTVMRWS